MKSLGSYTNEKREYELFQDETHSNVYDLEVTTLSGDFCFSAGLWTDKKNRVVDYDGVFQLSKPTIKAIRKLGLIVPKDVQ
jgi:hypothetical protein